MLPVAILLSFAAPIAPGDLQLTQPADLASLTSAALPLGAPLIDQPVDAAHRDGVFYVLGTSSVDQGSTQPLASLSTLDGQGNTLDTWVNDNSLERPVELFVPKNGAGAFVAARTNAANPTGTGVINAVSVLRVDGGQLSWRQQQTVSFFPDSIAVAGSADGQRVFSIYNAGGATSLVSLDPADGELRWGLQLQFGLFGVDVDCDETGDRVFVLLQASSPVVSDQVLAFDGATGSLLWSANITPVIGKPLDYSLLARPDGGQVFVGFEADGFAPRLLALNGNTGAVQWSLFFPGVTLGITQRVVAMAYDSAGPDLYVATTQGSSSTPGFLTVHAVRPVGVIQWTTPVPLSFPAGGFVTPDVELTFDHERVYVAADAAANTLGLAGLDVETGTVLWTNPGGPTLNFVASAAAVVNGQPTLLAAGTQTGPDGTADVRATLHQGIDGQVVWNTSFSISAGTPRFLGLAAPAGSNRLFALADQNDTLRAVFALQRDTLAPLWKRELSPAENFPLAPGARRQLLSDPSGQRVFAAKNGSASVTGLPPGLDALDGATGAPLWSLTFGFQDQGGLLPVSGNIADLEWADVNGVGPLVFSLHDGFNFGGLVTMRATNPATGATVWAERYFEASTSEFWRSGTMEVDAAAGVVYALVSRQIPNRLAILSRNASNGQLLDVTEIADQIQLVLPAIGVPRSADLRLSADAQHLFVLAEYLGTISTPARLVLARVAVGTGLVDWVSEIAPSQLSPSGFGEIQLSADGQLVAVAAGLRQPGLGERRYAGAFDAQTGTLLWSRIDGSAKQPVDYLDAHTDPSARALVLTGKLSSGAAQVLALDMERGTVLWESLAVASGGAVPQRAALLASDGDALYAGVDATEPSAPVEANVLRLAPGLLVSGPDGVSLSNPEAAVFLLQRPQGSAGAPYLVLGSATGNTPFPLGTGVDLPLVFDPYLELTLTGANQAPFVDTLGVLDAQGRARAELVLPTGLPAGLVGVTLYHAFLEWSAFGPVFASSAAELQLLP